MVSGWAKFGIFVLLSVAKTSIVAAPEQVATEGGVVMRLIPGGTFTMGDSKGEVDETPHEVSVSPFYMDQGEVTQEEYQRVMSENPSKVRNGKNPVEQVRWSDAVRYCNERSKLDGLEPCYDLEKWTCRFDANGYRLPTEAEWEYAARAGTKTAYSFGDMEAKLKFFGWYKGTSNGRPHPVSTRKANPWGLSDMHGNLWEWCNDFYDVGYYEKSAKEDPRGPDKGEKKVLRGGCWNSNPDACRSSYRYNEAPAYNDACFGYDIYGFRCVKRVANGGK